MKMKMNCKPVLSDLNSSGNTHCVSTTEVIPTDKVEVGFKDIDAAILVGSMPRKEGMERKDLLKANVAIFKTQGAALDKYAKKTVKVTQRLFECLSVGSCSCFCEALIRPRRRAIKVPLCVRWSKVAACKSA